MSTDDEIRKILGGRDIEILRKRFLCALNDMDGGGGLVFTISEGGMGPFVYRIAPPDQLVSRKE
jgi:hypothetical protein